MKRLENLNEPQLREVMSLAARGIEGAFRVQGVEKPLFVLVCFNDPKIGQYISNCRREDTVKAMKETAARLEAKEDIQR